jgi:hypothetical protein
MLLALISLPDTSNPVRRPVRAITAAAMLAPLLAACASTGATGTGAHPIKTIAGQSVRAPVRAAPRDPTFQTMPGLESVIGADESALVRQFGPARLNVWEGDARKLQFTGKACVLDVFLYPTTASRAPLASYVDARRSSDGKDVDRAACVAALKAR